MSIEDLKSAVCELVSVAEDVLKRKEFEKIDNKGIEIINCLGELEQDTYERAYKDGQDKGYSCGYSDGYNKAIDEFAKEIKDWQIDIQDNEYDADKFGFVFERIYEIAEELKGARE